MASIAGNYLKYEFKFNKGGLDPKEVEKCLQQKVDQLLKSANLRRIETTKNNSIKKVKQLFFRENAMSPGFDKRHLSVPTNIAAGYIQNQDDTPMDYNKRSKGKQGQLKKEKEWNRRYHELQHELFMGPLGQKLSTVSSTGTIVIGHKGKERGYLYQRVENSKEKLTAIQFCNVIDGLTEGLLKNLTALKEDNEPMLDDFKFKKVCDLIKEIVLGRNAVDWVATNNLMNESETQTWRDHVMVIISFAALMVVLLMILERGEEKVNSYLSEGAKQLSQSKFSSALQYTQRALDFSLKLFGEEHSKTAYICHSVGDIKHKQDEDFSACQFKQRALNIRVKVSREEQLSQADRYHSIGLIQHQQGDFLSALKSKQIALDIRLKFLGEEHASTANSYYSLGITQYALRDFSSDFQSTQRSLYIRLKLFGEEHSKTADSYHSLGLTQHAQGKFDPALQSIQRALDIRLKLFGEEHSDTADSYHSLGETQHQLGDFSSALQSKQRALDIRLKLFGEEHSDTADSYHSLGETQHQLGDFLSAAQSKQRALDIRRKLFGEEHPSTADSYHSLGDTQNQLGYISSARQSK